MASATLIHRLRVGAGIAAGKVAGRVAVTDLARGGEGLGDALGRASGHILQRLVLRSGFLNQNSSPCDAPNNNSIPPFDA